jgi:two-component system sensor kinase FixL
VKRSDRDALRESEARLRAIVNTAIEGIITIDERGRIDSINPAAQRMFGWSADELIGENVSRLMPSPYADEHDGYLARYRRTGQARIIGIGREVLGRRKDGTIFPVDLSVGEFNVRGTRRFTGIVRDITERRRLEREVLRISELEQQRIGQDLHDDLCQQLAGIEFMSQVLAQRLSSAGISEAKEAAEITRLVRQATRHTRDLSHGLSPVGLEADGLMTALEELAVQSSRRFQVEVGFHCPRPVLVTDSEVASPIYRIAQEAIHNAIKHGRPKRIEVTLTTVGQRIHLVIRDDGVGLPEKLPARRGLGLRLMQYRAAMVDGALVIQRNPEGGTMVTLALHRSFARNHEKKARPRRAARTTKGAPR